MQVFSYQTFTLVLQINGTVLSCFFYIYKEWKMVYLQLSSMTRMSNYRYMTRIPVFHQYSTIFTVALFPIFSCHCGSLQDKYSYLIQPCYSDSTALFE